MSLVFLIGARCAGKSCLGQRLAEKLDFDFVDTDHHLADIHGSPVADIVFREGWPSFRKYESQALREVSEGRRNRIVATGGGMILDEANRGYMKKNGLVLFLSAPAEVLSARLAADPQSALRPSLTGRSTLEEVSEVLEVRGPLYREASHRLIDAVGEIEAVIERCLEVIMERFPDIKPGLGRGRNPNPSPLAQSSERLG